LLAEVALSLLESTSAGRLSAAATTHRMSVTGTDSRNSSPEQWFVLTAAN